MGEHRTTRERVATIEADVKWIRAHIEENKTLEDRVSRLERLGAAVTAAFSLVGFWISNRVKS